MAQPGEDSCNDDEGVRRSRSFTKDSDAAFHATSVAVQIASKTEESTPKSDPTFIQNQISIQRSPSNAKEHASALSRQLSMKASGFDFRPSNITLLAEFIHEDDRARGRERSGSDSSVVEGVNNCTLSKSGSDRSAKSVRSLHALGSYPLGSLRVHSPSPTRKLRIDSHECLKSGDVVIIREIPAGSLIGYDTKALVIKKDEQFEGIKEIPSGAHFIWGGSSSASLRTGFWIMAAKRASDEYGEIHIRRWDSYAEVIDV
jgi:A1 cistron-splicing factor AAR2